MFANTENVAIFATGLNNDTIVFNAGEILKRPTRADCKSAVKTSQVRILLSPLKKKPEIIFRLFLWIFFKFFCLFFNKACLEFNALKMF